MEEKRDCCNGFDPQDTQCVACVNENAPVGTRLCKIGSRTPDVLLQGKNFIPCLADKEGEIMNTERDVYTSHFNQLSFEEQRKAMILYYASLYEAAVEKNSDIVINFIASQNEVNRYPRLKATLGFVGAHEGYTLLEEVTQVIDHKGDLTVSVTLEEDSEGSIDTRIIAAFNNAWGFFGENNVYFRL